MEKENDAKTMQQQLDVREPTEHITKSFKDVMSNGELETRIANYIQELADQMKKKDDSDKDTQGKP